MVSLKFPLQDPLQAVATAATTNTTIISMQLICLPTNRSLHSTLCRNCPQRVSTSNWVIKTVVNEASIGSTSAKKVGCVPMEGTIDSD